MPFLVAALSVVVAAVVRLLLDPLFEDRFLLPTFFAAVAFSAWYGGLGPALFAAFVGYVAADYFVIPPRHAVTIVHWDAAALNTFAAFLVVTATILVLSEVLTKATRRAQDVARRADEQRELLNVTLASIGDAVIATDAEERITFMNGVAAALTGWDAAAARGLVISKVFRIINETTRQAVDNPCSKVLRTRAIVGLANHTLLLSKDGAEHPIDDSAAPILDAAGGVLGVVLVFRDVTEQRRAAQTLQNLAAIVEQSDDAIISTSTEGTITSWNLAAEKLYGFTAAEAIGQHVDIITPAGHAEELAEIMRRLTVGERLGLSDTLRRRKNGTIVDVSLRISPIRNSEGHVIGASRVARDITKRKREEQSIAFLAQAGHTLAALTNRTSALQQVARLTVPFFADWCLVYCINQQGAIELVAHAHCDAEKERILQDVVEMLPLDWESAASSVQALRTGKTQLVAQIPDTVITDLARTEELRANLRKLNPRSLISAPLQIGDRTIGAITFVTSESHREYILRDVSFAESIANRAATALDNANLLLSVQDAVRQRDEFLAMLAHELRNPLSAIRYATALAQMPSPESRPELLDIIERQVGNLAHLIDDLLDVSRISQNKITLKMDHADAGTIASRALETARSLLEQKHHEVVVDIADTPMPLYVDSVRTEQVIANLLTNAAKYTPDGGRVTLRTFPENGWAIIKVTDTGIGLAPELLPRIFDLFAQADRSLDRSEGGLGIGLTLARRLAEMHGGTVSVTSAGLGQGSEFTVRLPLSEPNVVEAQNKPQTASHAPTALRILVVDDNRDTTRAAALLLKSRGHDVREAYDGPSAVNAAKDFHPHAVLLDLGLPGMSGFDVASTLRAEGFTNETLIAVSGYGQAEDRRRTQEVGFDFHLVKPVNHAELATILSGVRADNGSAS
jgi:PAS domain S-box-containing protein